MRKFRATTVLLLPREPDLWLSTYTLTYAARMSLTGQPARQAVRQIAARRSLASTRAGPSRPPPPRKEQQQPPIKAKLRSPAPAPSRPTANEPRFNYVANPFDPSPPDPSHASYRLVTARSLARSRAQDPPKRVRMLARDFIDDSLYNPHYGYFATKVEIFDPDLAAVESGSTSSSSSSSPSLATMATAAADEQVLTAATRAQGFDFGAFRSTSEFEDEVARRYQVFEGTGSGHESVAGASVGSRVGRQVWHTPTELFKVSCSEAAET